MKIAVIGSGPGGYVAALKCAQMGADVTVIEKDAVGGTCLNWGCIPTKAFVASAAALRTARNLSRYGIDSTGTCSPNIAKMIERKNKVIQTMGKGILGLFKNWGIAFVSGAASLEDRHTIRANAEDRSHVIDGCDRIILATGSRPSELPLFPFDKRRILSSDEILDIAAVPKSLIIIGAGVIGCEFAFIFSELGAQVTMIEMLDRPIATEDHEVSDLLAKELKKKKIVLKTGVSIIRSESVPDGVDVQLHDGSHVIAEKALVSVGRTLNTEGLGLEAIGLEKGQRNQIVVDDKMETSVRGIYAAGDAVGGMLLAHVASRQGIVAAVNACGSERRISYDAVPAGIFTCPEIGSVGLREHQAEEKGVRVKVGRFPFRALGKAHVLGELEGFVKTIADAATGRILGVHIIGPHATDLIHEGALAVHAGLSCRQLSEMIHAHPTLAEAVMESADDAFGMAIHAHRN